MPLASSVAQQQQEQQGMSMLLVLLTAVPSLDGDLSLPCIVWCAQVVLSHTPMRPLAAVLGQQPVLVVGRHEVAAVAASYGFRKVLTTRQLAAALGPGALPFLKHSSATASQQPAQGALNMLE
jgi:hypothetical protein